MTLYTGLRVRQRPKQSFKALTFDMGKPRVDLTKASSLASDLEDDEFTERHRGATR